MTIGAIIFDLDGTLWDSCKAVADSWNYSIERNYPPLIQPDEKTVRSIMGMTALQIRDSVFSAYGDRAQEVCDLCLAEEPEYICAHGANLYEGLDEVLEALSRSYPLFIVSNSQSGYIESFLHCSGVGKYISDYTCEGDTKMSKADNIRLIMKRNGIENAIYVGDTGFDEKSAADAGCPFVHAAYGFGSVSAPAAVIEKLTQLPDIIKLLEEGE